MILSHRFPVQKEPASGSTEPRRDRGANNKRLPVREAALVVGVVLKAASDADNYKISSNWNGEAARKSQDLKKSSGKLHKSVEGAEGCHGPNSPCRMDNNVASGTSKIPPASFIEPEDLIEDKPCSWCQKEQAIKAQPHESHGICKRHSAQLLEDAKRLAESEKRLGLNTAPINRRPFPPPPQTPTQAKRFNQTH